MKFASTLTVFLSAGIVAAGCAAPQSQALKQAQQSYSKVRGNPSVAQNAQVALYEAQQDLDKAKRAYNLSDQKHYAYLAQKRIELAESQARRAEIREQVQKLQRQQENFLMALKQRQAERARQQAEQAQQRLQAYQSQQRQRQLTRAQQAAERAQQENRQAQSQLQQLRNEMSDLKAKMKRTQAGTVLTLSDVVFGFDKAQLKPGAQLSLSRLAEFLKSHPDHKVLVEGFTDDRGSAGYNEQLSQQRAQAVAQALEADGVSVDRITTKGLGENYPVAPNSTAAERQQNRRVEITILNPGEQPQNVGKGKGRM